MRSVILGCGEVGQHLARELTRNGTEVVLVDRDPAALAAAEEGVDAMTLVGDVTHWSVLRRAGVEGAGMVAAVTGADRVNLVAAGIAAQAGAPRTLARADDRGLYRTEAAVERGVLGVSFMLCASRLIAHELSRLLRARHADHIADFAAHAVRTCILALDEDSPAVGRPASDLKQDAAPLVRAVIREGVLRGREEIPRLEPGDRLVLVGPPREVARAQDQLEATHRLGRVVLIGGGDVGHQLARNLGGGRTKVQIIERDPERCRVLSEELRDVSVFHGDGTSLALLRDQQVESADAVLAVTRSDDANLMASLLAHDLGVPSTYAIVHRHGYADVYAHLGVTGSVGPHDAIATMLRSLLPRDGLLQAKRVPDCSHELAEYLIGEGLPRELPIAELHLPAACHVLAVARDHHYVPVEPRTTLRALDQVVVAQPLHAQRDVVKRMAKVSSP
jgi:trk system potassium uptake protein TrkA